MKIGIINMSGNVGKTAVATHLFAPRMVNVPQFAVETINAGAADSAEIERLKGKQFNALKDELILLDHAIVDIGASNVEDFLRLMSQYHGSHEEFDYFVVPVVPKSDNDDTGKQMNDSIRTIQTLSALGVSPKRIRVIFNKVELDDVNDLQSQFAALFGFYHAEKKFTLRPDSVIYLNRMFSLLRDLRKTLPDILSDKTDYRALARQANDDVIRDHARAMHSAQQLSSSFKNNLDDVFKSVFK